MTEPDAIAGLADLAAAALSPTAPPGLQEETEQAVRRAWPRAVERVVAGQLAERLADGQPLGQVLADVAGRTLDTHLSRPKAALAFPTATEWLEQYLLPNYVRRPGTHRWCAQWWAHPEAVTRIEALWQSWESLRWDGPTGLAVWWKDYCDPHMAVLLSPEGPFFDCARGHTMPAPFPADPRPPEQD